MMLCSQFSNLNRVDCGSLVFLENWEIMGGDRPSSFPDGTDPSFPLRLGNLRSLPLENAPHNVPRDS